MSGLRILADDLTGALDSAAAFGAGVPVHLAVPADDAQHPAAIDVLATATRDVPIGQLPGQLEAALRWLAHAGLAFKKVDSLLRGNTFDEIALAARAGRFDRVLVAPAFPAQGRITLAGRQCLQSAGGTAQALDVPAIDAALRERGFDIATGSTPPPADAKPGTVWVPSVRDDADLEAIAGCLLADRDTRWLWCGSAGLAQALARRWRQGEGADRPAMQGRPRAATSSDTLLLVSASWQPASRRQWLALLEKVHADALVRGDATPAVGAAVRTLAQAAPNRTGPDHAPRLGLFDLAPAHALPADEARALLHEQVALIATLRPAPRQLVVVGGDTLLALCQAVDAAALRSATPLPRPGWGSATLVGGAWDGTRCHTRSGAFGGDDDQLAVLEALNARVR